MGRNLNAKTTLILGQRDYKNEKYELCCYPNSYLGLTIQNYRNSLY